MPIPVILLAAGASARLGKAKQLVVYRGEALLTRAARIALESGALPLVVVLGAHANEILAAVHLDIATVVINHEWGQGIASSIRAGMGALNADARGVMMLGCDQPRLTVRHLRALLAEFEALDHDVIVASAYAGVRGIPAVFPRSAFGRLKELTGDGGARTLLMDPAFEVVDVDFEGGEIDIDVPGDLAQLD